MSGTVTDGDLGTVYQTVATAAHGDVMTVQADGDVDVSFCAVQSDETGIDIAGQVVITGFAGQLFAGPGGPVLTLFVAALTVGDGCGAGLGGTGVPLVDFDIGQGDRSAGDIITGSCEACQQDGAAGCVDGAGSILSNIGYNIVFAQNADTGVIGDGNILSSVQCELEGTYLGCLRCGQVQVQLGHTCGFSVALRSQLQRKGGAGSSYAGSGFRDRSFFCCPYAQGQDGQKHCQDHQNCEETFLHSLHSFC